MPQLSASFRVQKNHTYLFFVITAGQSSRAVAPQTMFYHRATDSSVPPASTHDSTGCIIQQHVMKASWQAQDRRIANSLEQLQLNQTQTGTCASKNRILPPVGYKNIQQSSNEQRVHWTYIQSFSRAFAKLRNTTISFAVCPFVCME
jgi:hypothetical protein